MFVLRNFSLYNNILCVDHATLWQLKKRWNFIYTYVRFSISKVITDNFIVGSCPSITSYSTPSLTKTYFQSSLPLKFSLHQPHFSINTVSCELQKNMLQDKMHYKQAGLDNKNWCYKFGSVYITILLRNYVSWRSLLIFGTQFAMDSIIIVSRAIFIFKYSVVTVEEPVFCSRAGYLCNLQCSSNTCFDIHSSSCKVTGRITTFHIAHAY